MHCNTIQKAHTTSTGIVFGLLCHSKTMDRLWCVCGCTAFGLFTSIRHRSQSRNKQNETHIKRICESHIALHRIALPAAWRAVRHQRTQSFSAEGQTKCASRARADGLVLLPSCSVCATRRARADGAGGRRSHHPSSQPAIYCMMCWCDLQSEYIGNGTWAAGAHSWKKSANAHITNTNLLARARANAQILLPTIYHMSIASHAPRAPIIWFIW